VYEDRGMDGLLAWLAERSADLGDPS
jgi:hypothetical protein